MFHNKFCESLSVISEVIDGEIVLPMHIHVMTIDLPIWHFLQVTVKLICWLKHKFPSPLARYCVIQFGHQNLQQSPSFEKDLVLLIITKTI
jgi:hypothetical protein